MGVWELAGDLCPRPLGPVQGGFPAEGLLAHHLLWAPDAGIKPAFPGNAWWGRGTGRTLCSTPVTREVTVKSLGERCGMAVLAGSSAEAGPRVSLCGGFRLIRLIIW